MGLQPLGARVLVKPQKAEEKTAAGIILPDTAKEKPQQGKVVAVGSGRLLTDGKRAQMEIKTGDQVIYAKYGGTELKHEGEKYLIISESDILAIIE